jgi:hypothetical protein
MTARQLGKLGIIPHKNKSNPDRYWCNVTQCFLTIYKADTMEDVLEMIFKSGVEQGITEGKQQRSQEIRDLLGF